MKGTGGGKQFSRSIAVAYKQTRRHVTYVSVSTDDPAFYCAKRSDHRLEGSDHWHPTGSTDLCPRTLARKTPRLLPFRSPDENMYFANTSGHPLVSLLTRATRTTCSGAAAFTGVDPSNECRRDDPFNIGEGNWGREAVFLQYRGCLGGGTSRREDNRRAHIDLLRPVQE